MKVGYVRVSTEEQHIDRQLEIMKKYNVEKIYTDKLSGKNTNRPEFTNMMNFVRLGDTVIIESYSRLARSTRDLLDTVDKLSTKGVQLISDKENIDTATPTGKLFLTIIAGLSEFERECMLQRQKEGIAVAKANGKYKGRKPLPFDEKQFKAECKKWIAGEQTAIYTMKRCGMKPNRFYIRAKEFGFKKGK